ncbi:hypothetical protein EOPP23_17750 [Endozoicomonas sp. OPT23]|uniref:insulinase family protein n=1 Tax=Endozoicomonas sp. OPT23 TaxID=2072845 RepID=UPI00129B82F2|nr:insulinase family protein [Endozoicomonas sp. OPT23]MRI34825.1 hypothetical protein [Endozoicomonas sp. OPT23]
MVIKHVSWFAGILATVLLGGCTLTAERDPMDKTSQVIIKSPADDRDYRYLTLDNGLKALLISDPDTDKAAAAVDVNVGSWQDPDNRLGLAHFLEHMLFLGNAKYPEVDSYFKFIRANGGNANAYTANTRTNYFFDINSDQLQPALDQLAQFFVSPSLDPEYVERERNAVDSEYKLHAKEDSWRLLIAQNATSNPEHPKSRFNIGSLETLENADGVSLWKDLKTFYDRYYVASNIGVVVYGKESVDTLEQWLKTSFKDVPVGEKIDTVTGKAPYSENQLGVRINLEPLKDTRILSLSFPMASQYHLYRKKPLGYLARILGYEGAGSLHSYLKQRGLIESLAAYSSDVPDEYSEFNVRMELTESGLEQVDDITAIVFDYLNLIRQQGIQQWMYEESGKIADLGFRYQEDYNPQSTASGLASRIHDVPAGDILNANYLYEEFDPELINSLLLEMTPGHLRQTVIAQGLRTNKVEPYFGTHYRISGLSSQLKKRLSEPQMHTELTIPKPNNFVATDLELRKADVQQEPVRLVEKPGFTLWNMTDNSFQVPRANIRIKISTDKASDTAEDIVLLQLYRALLSRSLNEFGYPAREAGLHYGLSSGREGLVIALSGYQDKQSLLLKKILDAVSKFKPREVDFEQERDLLARRIRNRQFQPPYRLAMDLLSQELFPRNLNDDEILAAAGRVDLQKLQAFAADFYDAIHVSMLVHGNFSQTEAEQLAALVDSRLLNDGNRTEAFKQSFNVLDDVNETIENQFQHNDSVYVSYFQRPETSNKSRAIYSLLGRLLATPFANQLRTEQQLGYVVFASARPIERHPGLIFVVQSPVLGPEGIADRVDDFLEGQVQKLKKLSDKELEQYRQGLIGDLLKKDANLDERSGRFWQILDGRESGFDFQKQIAEEVRKVKVKDIQTALDVIRKDKGRLTISGQGKTKEPEPV